MWRDPSSKDLLDSEEEAAGFEGLEGQGFISVHQGAALPVVPSWTLNNRSNLRLYSPTNAIQRRGLPGNGLSVGGKLKSSQKVLDSLLLEQAAALHKPFS